MLGLLPGHLGAATEAAPMSWQDAVAELAGERTRAETCVRLLKRHAKDDEATLSRGELAYGSAKSEMDAVLAALIVAVAVGEEPASFSTLETRLDRALAEREAFCAEVRKLVPDDSGTKGIWDTLVGGLIGPVVDAVKEAVSRLPRTRSADAQDDRDPAGGDEVAGVQRCATLNAASIVPAAASQPRHAAA